MRFPGDLPPGQRGDIQQSLTQNPGLTRGFSARGLFTLFAAGLIGMFARRMVPYRMRRMRYGMRRFHHHRRGRFRFFAFGLLIMVLSITTCSAGVDLTSLTAKYGEPVPSTPADARRFVERAAGALQAAGANRGVHIMVSSAEATSALSLGLMIPELMQAMQTISPEEIQQAADIGKLRAILRERRAAPLAQPRTWSERLTRMLDPQLRMGDVQVRFTEAGQIVVAGYVQAWRWQQPGLVVFAPRARAGELELDFVEGKLGRLPAPEWAFDRLGELVSSLILRGREYGEITNLTVENDRLTFEAAVRG